MILNKLRTMSFARLLHVALSLLCVLALALGLASGALAASGDYTIDDSFSFYSYSSTSSSLSYQRVHIDKYDNASQWYTVCQGYMPRQLSFVIGFPAPASGSISWDGAIIDQNFNYIIYPSAITSTELLSSSGSVITSYTSASSIDNVSFTDVTFIRFTVSIAAADTHNTSTLKWFAAPSFSNLEISSGSGSGSSGGLDQDILDGITAIAQSLLDLETGPYYWVSGVTPDQNGDLQHTLLQNASLEDLLNGLGLAGTDTFYVIRGIYNNFGSYFTLYSIDDSTSSTTQVYRGLPQYVNALGQSVTDGINRLQRDHDLLYQQTADLADALYADTYSNPSESWSLAEWLRGIFNSINSFFTSFWSPAETDLKSAAEAGMQEAADRGIAGSADQVGSMDDLGSGFSSFGDTGNVGAGDILNSLTSGDYSFFSETTQDNLSYRPPVSENRGLRSAPSDPVEYVDELSRNRDYLREVLGLP